MSPQCNHKGKKNYQTEKNPYTKDFTRPQSHNF